MDRATLELVRQRAGARCEYCQMPQAYDALPFQIDHIIARKHGGADTEDNLALSCFACNNRKGPNIAGIDPMSSEVVRLFHPRLDSWSDHFRWDGPLLVGLTSYGRTTVAVLMINLDYRAAVRQSLIAEGVFAPDG